MANEEHLKILKQGVKVWNKWRKENPGIQPDLSEAKLSREDLSRAKLCEANLTGAYLTWADLCGAELTWADLRGANLYRAYLSGANLSRADLRKADLVKADLVVAKLTKADLRGAELTWADLRGANLYGADLSWAKLYGVDLSEADLSWADLTGANLTGARLRGVDLSKADLNNACFMGAQLVKTNFEKATLKNCKVYGISAWDLKGEPLEQSNLIITPPGEPTITVDNLEVAQFIYLLLYNKKIRHVIDTITSKVVLILGRFTDERMKVLDAIEEELRKHKNGYVPVVFKFEKPASQTFIETVSTLAHLARFVIADFTRAKIILEEVPHIVKSVSVPVIPLLKGSGKEPVTLYNLRVNHRSLLDTYRYKNLDDLLASFEKEVIIPAEAKVTELKEIKAKELSKSKRKRP